MSDAHASGGLPWHQLRQDTITSNSTSYHMLKAKKSVAAAHRTMKFWPLASGRRDALLLRRSRSELRHSTPDSEGADYDVGEGRQARKQAWRRGYRGLACIIAIAYDAQFAPVDPSGRAAALPSSYTASRDTTQIVANTVASSAQLQKTYLPVNAAAGGSGRSGPGRKLKLSARES